MDPVCESEKFLEIQVLKLTRGPNEKQRQGRSERGRNKEGGEDGWWGVGGGGGEGRERKGVKVQNELRINYK